MQLKLLVAILHYLTLYHGFLALFCRKTTLKFEIYFNFFPEIIVNHTRTCGHDPRKKIELLRFFWVFYLSI